MTEFDRHVNAMILLLYKSDKPLTKEDIHAAIGHEFLYTDTVHPLAELERLKLVDFSLDGTYKVWLTNRIKIEIDKLPFEQKNYPYGYFLENRRKALDKPTTEVNNTYSPSTPPKTSVLEIISWIVGIIVGAIAIYEFIIKKFL